MELAGTRPGVVLPPDKKTQDSGQETIVYEVDTIVHLGAARAGQGLTNAEELLILADASVRMSPFFKGKCLLFAHRSISICW